MCFPFVLEPAQGRWVPDQKVLPCPNAGYRIPSHTTAPIQVNVGSRRVEHHENSRVNLSVAQLGFLDKSFHIGAFITIDAIKQIKRPNHSVIFVKIVNIRYYGVVSLAVMTQLVWNLHSLAFML